MSTFSFTEKQSLLLRTLYFRKFHLAVFLLQKVSLGCIFASESFTWLYFCFRKFHLAVFLLVAILAKA